MFCIFSGLDLSIPSYQNAGTSSYNTYVFDFVANRNVFFQKNRIVPMKLYPSSFGYHKL